MKKYEFFDVTADVGFRAYGNTMEEAFENAALATFEVITDTTKIRPSIKREVHITSEDPCALLYDWLDEMIFLHDSEFLIFNRFKLEITKKEGEYVLKGDVWGESFNQDIHEIREDVKAVTYHLMDVKEENGFTLRVILDI
ncbi:MAG TPA: archease [Methanobacterium sp.]|nr:archease [Methanobacterium sp.]